MKKLIIIAAASFLLLIGCTPKEAPEVTGQAMTVTASTESGTKTFVRNGGTQVYWGVKEEIKLFCGGSSGLFVSQNTSSAVSAEFSGTLTTTTGESIWGLYPYRDDASCNGSYITTVLPQEQSTRSNSFDTNTFIAIARSDSPSLSFRNVCGGLRFTLTQEGITKIIIRGANNEKLAGKIMVGFDSNGDPKVQRVLVPCDYVAIVPKSQYFKQNEWYYMTLLPTELPDGFTVEFYRKDAKAVCTTTKSFTIKRGIFGSVAEIDKDLEFNAPPTYEAVDLGLSVKWATANVGASTPEGYGDYFAWGEIEPKSYFDWETYLWCNGNSSSLTKYNSNSNQGAVDDLTALLPEDDAASIKCGPQWRTPTEAEWTELRYDCNWEWTTVNGVNGYKVSGTKSGYTDKSIFLPAAGICVGSLRDKGYNGYYWASMVYPNGTFQAKNIRFQSNAVMTDEENRCEGLSIRPVYSIPTGTKVYYRLSGSKTKYYLNGQEDPLSGAFDNHLIKASGAVSLALSDDGDLYSVEEYFNLLPNGNVSGSSVYLCKNRKPMFILDFDNKQDQIIYATIRDGKIALILKRDNYTASFYILMINPDGTSTKYEMTGSYKPSHYRFRAALAPDGNLYVTANVITPDNESYLAMYKYTADGASTESFIKKKTTSHESAIAITDSGDIYILDKDNDDGYKYLLYKNGRLFSTYEVPDSEWNSSIAILAHRNNVYYASTTTGKSRLFLNGRLFRNFESGNLSFGCAYPIQISATGDIYLSLFDKIYKNDSILYSTEDQFFDRVCVVD
ncbi:MAG: hypothetical protein IKH11_06620 [Bacteroidales bacterium]|nr:hypothetical protein [Bacteroidales bacterium]